MLALSFAPELSLHIQVTGTLLHCKHTDKNQDYSNACCVDDT